MQCPICKKKYKNAAGFSQHVKHNHRGQLVRMETVKANQPYGFRNTVTYIKPENNSSHSGT